MRAVAVATIGFTSVLSSSNLVPLVTADHLKSNTMRECYDIWGNVNLAQTPCLTDDMEADSPTWCCDKADYCLSNGLCLDPQVNNFMTQQGCTDQQWGSPCNKYCPAIDGEFLTLHRSS